MGTETLPIAQEVATRMRDEVKLNNPLMGTETYLASQDVRYIPLAC